MYKQVVKVAQPPKPKPKPPPPRPPWPPAEPPRPMPLRGDKRGDVISVSGGQRKEAKMRYRPKSIAGLQVALGGLPASMHVESDRDIDLSAKTVGELRKVTAWPENLVITTPQERDPDSAIKVTRASVTTRLAPKP